MLIIQFVRVLTLSLLLSLSIGISKTDWHNQTLIFANFFYPIMSKFVPPEPSKPKAIPGIPISIVTIDTETIKKLGWPIHPKVWQDFVTKIAKTKPKAILNLFRFNQRNFSAVADKFAIGDTFGSSLSSFPNTSILTGPEEDVLVQKALLSTVDSFNKEIIPLPIAFEENEELVQSYKKIGLLQNFQENQRNNCFEIFKEFRSQKGLLFTVPFSTYWGIEKLMGLNLETENAASHNPTQQSEHRLKKIHCFKKINLTTPRYLEDLGIKKVGMANFISGIQTVEKGHFVILSADGIDQFYPSPSETFLPPHFPSSRGDLVARILAETSNQQSVQIGSGIITEHQALIFIIFCIISSFGIFLGYEWLGLLICAGAFSAALSLIHRTNDNYEIPSILLSSFSIMLILVSFSNFLVNALRNRLAKTITLRTLPSLLATNSPLDVDEVISSHAKKFFLAVDPRFFLSFDRQSIPVQAAVKNSIYLKIASIFLSFMDRMSMKIARKTFFELRTKALDEVFNRQKKQQYLIEIAETKSKSDILGKFLSNSLISKMTQGNNFTRGLTDLLKPSHEMVSIMQADIRGFSNLTAIYPPEEVVALLQAYFRETVDYAQNFAQVKLIGDAIFLFSIKKDVAQSSELILQSALQLIKSTINQNAKHEDDLRIRFGIALNFGKVVVGNLSSDDCIDFTIIGNEVNKTARLEELTKNPIIARIIGKNGFLITRDFYDSLDQSKNLGFQWINLETLDISVRSFPDMKEVGYLIADF